MTPIAKFLLIFMRTQLIPVSHLLRTVFDVCEFRTAIAGIPEAWESPKHKITCLLCFL